MINIDGIPKELKNLNQWVCCDKNKVPRIAGTWKKASSTDRSTWRTFEETVEAFNNGKYSGIGFVFTKDDPYCFIDLDDCLDSETGEIDELAHSIIQSLNGFTEISQSGKGIHVFVKAELPDHKAKTDHARGVEIYDTGRYCFMTANLLNGYPRTIEARQEQVNQICQHIFGKIETLRQIPSSTSDRNDIENLKNIPILDVVNRLGGLNLGGKLQGNCPTGHDSDGGKCFSLNVKKNYFHCFNCGIGGDTIRLVEKVQGYNFNDAKTWLSEQFNIPINKTSKAVDPVITEPENEEKPLKSFNHTDYGNAERLVYWHGDNIRYCDPMKSWFVWDSKRWKPDNLAIERLAKDTVRRIYSEASLFDDADKRKSIASHGGKSEANNRIQAMISLARSESGVIINPDDLDRDGFLLNCKNGTINLKTGELQEYHKGDFITKIIPIEYDKKAKCPKWEQFLNEIFKDDKDLIHFIQYAVGYSLTNSVNEQCFFICYGGGANGKSVFLDTMEFIFGDYGRRVNPSTFEDMHQNGAREDIAGLKQIRYISTIETGQGKRLAENLLKQMTGDSTIRARFLYQNSFEFEQTYKIWIATNHKPTIRGTDEGIWRRVRLIPFEFTITPEKQNKNLRNELRDEAPGILQWAIEGCINWALAGLHCVTPEKVAKATDNYRKEMDTIKSFLDECCLTDKDKTVKVSELHNVYLEWSGDRISRKEFGRKISDLGHKKEKLPAGICWIGIGLINEQ